MVIPTQPFYLKGITSLLDATLPTGAFLPFFPRNTITEVSSSVELALLPESNPEDLLEKSDLNLCFYNTTYTLTITFFKECMCVHNLYVSFVFWCLLCKKASEANLVQ